MGKKKIGIVSLGYGWLPCESGPSRFYYIAKLFSENGYDVDLIGSDFQHFQKKRRERDVIRKQRYPFNVTFIPVPAYQKNLDLKRIYSNKIAARRVVSYMKTQEYDVVYCSIPANDIAAKVGKYCNARNIPYVVDIEDLWPEAMEMVIKIPLIKNVLFWPFMRDAEKAYRYADAIVGTSDEYTARAYKNNGRTIRNKTVYVGCDVDEFDRGVKEYAEAIEKQEEEFWIMYAGSLGKSYDIRTLIFAAEKIKNKGFSNIRIKILGSGPLQQELNKLSKDKGCNNVEFLGYIKYEKMAAYLSKADVTVNSFIKGAPQSIVNKIGDYLASGKPMINTLENEEFMNLVLKEGFGTNIEPENEEALADCIIKMYQKKDNIVRMGKNARRLAEERFDRKKSYLEIIKIVEEVEKDVLFHK